MKIIAAEAQRTQRNDSDIGMLFQNVLKWFSRDRPFSKRIPNILCVLCASAAII